MRAVTIAGLLSLAQAYGAAISGTIADPAGAAVASAPVQLRNAVTRTIRKTVSAPDGKYRFTRLAAGTYELSVPDIGVTLAKYERRGITLTPADALQMDIRLDWGPNLGTPGDDFQATAVEIRRRSPPPSGPVPRTPEGKPDLSGVWNGHDDPNPEEPALLPWAQAVMKKRRSFDTVGDNPAARCLPNGVPIEGSGVFKIIQTPTLVIMMLEDVIGYRQVFLDGRGHPKDWDPSWNGHSIGRWERDTLVVDATGFNDKSWLNLYPHTERLHIVERYRRRDLGHLEVQITIEDPETFSRPWKRNNVWELAPQEDVLEYVCNENNRDLPHLPGK